jgi:hypothetical protein
VQPAINLKNLIKHSRICYCSEFNSRWLAQKPAIETERKEQAMTRTIKLLVLTLAISALGTAAAQAEPALFTAAVGANETAKGVGEQIGVSTFTLSNGLTMTCATAKGTGQALSKGPSFEKITIEAFGETCHVVIAGLTKPITITPNGCGGVFTAKTEAGKFTADQEFECPEGKGIEVHVYNKVASHTETLCTYEIPPQTHPSEGELINKVGTPSDIVAAGTVKNIKVKRLSGPLSICGPEESTATAKGEITIRATNEAGEFVNGAVSG